MGSSSSKGKKAEETKITVKDLQILLDSSLTKCKQFHKEKSAQIIQQKDDIIQSIKENDLGFNNYDFQYNNSMNDNNSNITNISRINNTETEKKDNLNEESNNIADKLSRIQALISQVSGK